MYLRCLGCQMACFRNFSIFPSGNLFLPLFEFESIVFQIQTCGGSSGQTFFVLSTVLPTTRPNLKQESTRVNIYSDKTTSPNDLTFNSVLTKYKKIYREQDQNIMIRGSFNIYCDLMASLND